MRAELANDEAVKEARCSVERALGGIDTLHCGPLDYNISTTTDDLKVAIRLLEQFGQQHAGRTSS